MTEATDWMELIKAFDAQHPLTDMTEVEAPPKPPKPPPKPPKKPQ